MSSDKPHDADSDSDEELSGNDADEQVQQSIEPIAELFLKQLVDGTANLNETVSAHPDLAPHLEKRLKVLMALVAMSKSVLETRPRGSKSEKRKPTEQAHRINCPNCGVRIQVVQINQPAEVTCGGCGSTIQVDPGSTGTQAAEWSPEHIGKFEVVSLLGRGGFGSVYKAMDPDLNRLVAVKVPRDGYFPTDNERLRFIREACNAAKLRHDRIVRILDVAEDTDFPYIVSELIDGLTLSDLISGRQMSFREIAELVAKVSEAIEYAHSQGVIHRDIKPSNILLDHEQNPYVADFGLAIDKEDEITMTMDGEILGTPAYMSPEQARGESSRVDRRSDVYSLGTLLYRLLSGNIPFHGSKRMMIHQVLNEDPPPPRRINDHIPRDLEIITLKAMAKEPRNRYQSAGELQKDLKRWLNKEPILARPETAWGRFKKWCHRKPAIASLSLSIVFLLLTGVILSVVWAVREQGLRKLATNNFNLAESRRQESDLRLREIYLQNGSRLLEDNDLIESLVWFLNAAKVNENPESNDWLRINLVLDQCPTLTHLWSVGEKIQMAGFSKDYQRIFAVNESNDVLLFATADDDNFVRLSHSAAIQEVQFSPSAELIVVAAGTEASLWRVDSRVRIALLKHQKPIVSTEFNSTGNKVATGSIEGVIKIWNAEDGTLIRDLDHDGAEVRLGRFFEDGKRYLTVTTDAKIENSTLTIWNVETGTKIKSFIHPGQVLDVAFGSDGNQILSAGTDRTVRLWDVQSGEQMGQPLVHAFSIKHVFFGADKNSVISVTTTGMINRWDQSSGQRIRQFNQESAINHSTLSEDGSMIASAFTDGRVRVRWMDNGELVCSNLPCGTSASRVFFAGNSRTLLTAGNDGVLRIWDLAGIVPDIRLLKHNGPVLQARFSPDGKRVVTCSRDATGCLWDANTGNRIGNEMAHELDVMDCDFSSDGQFVVTVSADKTAQLWDGYNGSPIGPRREHDAGFLRVRFGNEPQKYLAAAIDGKAIAWNAKTLGSLFQVAHEKQIKSVAFTKKGDRFATASADKTVSIWNSENGYRIGSPLAHRSRVTYCQFDPTDSFLATCSADGATIWNLDKTDQPPQVLKHSHAVSSCCFNYDGTKLLTTDYGGNATVWELNNKVFEKQFSYSLGNYSLMFGEFSPDGKLIVLSGEKLRAVDRRPGNGLVFLLDSSDGIPIASPLPHLGQVRRVHFDASGDQIVSASLDHAASIWKLGNRNYDDAIIADWIQILAGSSINTGQQSGSIFSSIQQSNFHELKKTNPELFRCDDFQEKQWTRKIEWYFPKPEDSTPTDK